MVCGDRVIRVLHGRRLRGTGKLLDGGTAHATVPPIFREVVLSDACESAN